MEDTPPRREEVTDMLVHKPKALHTPMQGDPNTSIALANLRLNLHETLTSRVAKKSDTHWLPSPTKQRGDQTQQRGANANISRTLPNPKPD
jgi:hypothetical protein